MPYCPQKLRRLEDSNTDYYACFHLDNVSRVILMPTMITVLMTMMATDITRQYYQLDDTPDKGWDLRRNCRDSHRGRCTLPSSGCSDSWSCSGTSLQRSCALLSQQPTTTRSSSHTTTSRCFGMRTHTHFLCI